MASSLQTLRRALAGSLDDIGVYGLAAATATTITVTALADTTPNASHNRYDGRWVYFASGASAGAQRRVIAGGFDPAAGILTLELGGVTAAAGDVVELTGLFPCADGIPPEDASYRSLINRAAGLLARPAEISVPIATGQLYDLAVFSYLDRPSRLLRVLEPGPRGRAPVDAGWRGWRWRPGTAGSYLELRVPFSSAGGALTLEVIRPVRDWVYRAVPGWGPGGEGLTADTDYFDIDATDALGVGRMIAYETLAARSPGRPLPGAADALERYTERAHASRLWDRTQEADAQPPAAAAAG